MASIAAVGWSISIASWIMSPIVTKILNEGFEFLGFDESEKLQDLESRVLPRLALMLERAERIPVEQRARVEQWAARLRSTIYDAEDVVDIADYNRLQCKVIPQTTIKIMLRAIKEKGLRRILEKLEKLIVEGSQFLPELTCAIDNHSDTSNPRDQVMKCVTTSALPEIVFGRNNDCENIVRMLHEAPDDSDASASGSQCYSVIGIYGVAGSGKTNLAQYVCTVEKKEKYFSLIIWINVSQTFNIGEIYQEMLEAATGEPSSKFRNLDTLERKLEAELTNKKVLLVLDDIWPDKNVAEHNLKRLLSPLKNVKRGSKILTTSRFRDAAKALGAQVFIPIPDMDQNDLVDLFFHCALDGAELDDRVREEFVMIGREIVKKLKGSPLAATVVAARLRKQLNAAFWRRVVGENLFTGTMGSLWWSFQNLDDKVQRCFVYCSIFPKATRFKRDELVNMWIAEGFVNANAVEDLEDVGGQYLDELVSCSFLKKEDNGMFHMHDLIHELAGMASGSDCFRFEEGDAKRKTPPGNTRYLYVDLYDPVEVLEGICKMKKLRTLIISPKGNGLTEESLDAIIKRLRSLRVLKVKVQRNGMVPASVCQLLHLRYLSIHTSSPVHIELPRKFDQLYHLQIIEFTGLCNVSCYNVKSMNNLISLRHIACSLGPPYIPMEHCLHFPGIGKLALLRTLGHFNVKKEKGYELQQLGSLNHLHGSLKISGLENVKSKAAALQAKLVDKKYLTEVSLVWAEHHGCPLGLQAEVLEGLQPPCSLTRLTISCYGGSKYPSWLSEDQQRLRHLQCLELEFCLKLEALPEIRELVHLHELILRSLHKLKSLPILPQNLKILQIFDCFHFNSIEGKYPSWLSEDQQRLRHLQCLELEFCLELEALPEIRELVHLHELILRSLHKLKSLPILPQNLKILQIFDCFHFNSIEGIREFTNLETLDFTIVGCPNIRPLEDNEKIQVVGSICIDDLSVVKKLFSREACACQNFLQILCSEKLGDEEVLLQFDSLSTLWFEDCNIDMLPSNLKFLTSMCSLVLNRCKNIRSLPTLPAKLQYFVACDCNERFMETCKSKDHPNWRNIGHVPEVILRTDALPLNALTSLKLLEKRKEKAKV